MKVTKELLDAIKAKDEYVKSVLDEYEKEYGERYK